MGEITENVEQRDDQNVLVSLDPVQIDALTWQPLPDVPGVYHKMLWRHGDMVQWMLHYQPGSTTAGEPHIAAHHHIWVISGGATIGGRRLAAGSYAHIPPGVAHPTEHVDSEGCTLLQMYSPSGA